MAKHEIAKNSPQEAYDYIPENDWPKIEESKELYIERDKVKGLIKALERDYLRYKDAAKPGISGSGFADRTELNANDAGAGHSNNDGFPGGRLVYKSIQNAGQKLPATYKSFLNNYEQVIESLWINAGFYDKAERDSLLTGRDI